jgi:hypothetical protein
MTSLRDTMAFTPRRQGIAMGFLAALLGMTLVVAVSVPNLLRSRMETEPLALAPFAMQMKPAAPAPAAEYGIVGGVIGGVPGGVPRGTSAAKVPPNDDRKIIKTAQLSLIAADPLKAAEAARAIAEQFGGYAVSVRVGTREGARAQLTLRVPAAEFEQTRAALHKLGSRIEDEQIEAEDATRQYVDTEATLKSYRAEQGQYLEIMHRAGSIKDVLAVTEKLADVRERIERTEAEFRSLSQQVAMASFTVSLRSETEAQTSGLHWRPLYQVKVAFRDGMESLADYGVTMLAVLTRLPAITLWAVTLLLALKYAWLLLRRYWKGLAGRALPAAKEPQASTGGPAIS